MNPIRRHSRNVLAVVCATILCSAMISRAAFHLWNIREVYTDSSGSKQFIEFFTTSGSEQFVGGRQISVGNGVTTNTFTIPSNLPGSTANKAFLIGTASITNFGSPAPDYVIPDNFIFTNGGTITFFGANSGAYTNLATDGILSRTWNAGNATNSPQNFAGTVGMITNSDAPPSISITNPPNGSIFSAPATFTLAATASDPGGAVSQVEFFQGGTSLGVVTNSPYSIGVSNLASGAYSFSAVATDNNSDKATNSISVTVNALPSVTITNPPNSSIFNAPATFTLASTASDPDGTISQVEFFRGGTSLGVITNSPYSVGVSNLASGAYSFSAVATDNNGGNATNSISVTVNALPSVTITNPANGSIFDELASFTLAATAADSDGTITQVEFFQSNTTLGVDSAAPYSVAVSNLTEGAYTFSAVATDNNGALGSNSIAITVNGLLPIVLKDMQRLSDSEFRFSFAANPGRTYLFERAEALSVFAAIKTNVAQAQSMTFTDATATGFTNFYRVVRLTNQ